MPIVPRKFLGKFRKLRKDSEVKAKEMRKLRKQAEHFEDLWEKQKITNIRLLTENIELKDERRKRQREDAQPGSMAKRVTYLSEALAREEMRGDYYQRCYNELYAAKRIAMAEERRRTLRFVYHAEAEDENQGQKENQDSASETESSEELDSDGEVEDSDASDDQEDQGVYRGPYLFKEADEEEDDELLNC